MKHCLMMSYSTELDFTAPGLYHFMLRENPGHNPNIAYSDQSYLLDVQVVWETEDNGSQTGNLKVSGIATTSAATNQKSEGAGFRKYRS